MNNKKEGDIIDLYENNMRVNLSHLYLFIKKR